MSTVIVLAPMIVAGWPVITAAVTAAIGTMGFTVARTSASGVREHVNATNRAEIEVENSEILQNAGTAEELVVERDGMRAVFSRDARGALKLCMEGAGYSKAELKQMGEELLGRVTQQYVYHRIVTELKDRRMAIVDEQLAEDRTVKIRVRNF